MMTALNTINVSDSKPIEDYDSLMEEISETLAAGVVRILKARGLSYRAAVKGTDIPHASIAKIVNLDVSPAVTLLERMAQAWKIPAWTLIHPGLSGREGLSKEADELVSLYLALDEEGREYLLSTARREMQRGPSQLPDISELGLTPRDEQGNIIAPAQPGRVDKK